MIIKKAIADHFATLLTRRIMDTVPQNILVVEDEAAHAEAIRRVLENSLTESPVRITVVSTLAAYRHQIAILPPDIAIIDLNLPVCGRHRGGRGLYHHCGRRGGYGKYSPVTSFPD